MTRLLQKSVCIDLLIMIFLYGNGTVTYKGDRKERELMILRVVLMSFILLNVYILYGKGTVKYKRDEKGESDNYFVCNTRVFHLVKCLYLHG